MSQMNSKERFFALFNGKDADRPSVINPVSVATTESINALGLDFAKVHLDAEKMAALACYSHEVLGYDSIMPYFSVAVEGAALNAEIKWGDNQTMPSQHSEVFSEPEQVKVPADYLDRPPIRALIDAVKIIVARHGNNALVLGKALGPWTLSLRNYGMENSLIDTIDDPEKLAAIMKGLKEFTRVLTQALLEAGAHMVTIADHTTRNLIGPNVYDQFLKPLHQELNAEFPGKLILHCCGNTEDRVHLFAKGGFPVFHYESANDTKNTIKLAGSMKLTGCVSTNTLLKGSQADVINEVKKILSDGVNIISPECAVPMSTPNSNLKAIVDHVKTVSLGG